MSIVLRRVEWHIPVARSILLYRTGRALGSQKRVVCRVYINICRKSVDVVALEVHHQQTRSAGKFVDVRRYLVRKDDRIYPACLYNAAWHAPESQCLVE